MTLLDLDNLERPYHEQIDELRKAADADTPPDVRDYYDGHQPIVATPDQMAALGPRADRPYIENVIKQCTDTMAGRLLFRQYLCEDGPHEQEWLEGFSRRNQMGEQVITNTVRVLVDGNNGMSLSWHVGDKGAGRPMVHQEPWWDGKEGVFIEVGIGLCSYVAFGKSGGQVLGIATVDGVGTRKARRRCTAMTVAPSIGHGRCFAWRARSCLGSALHHILPST